MLSKINSKFTLRKSQDKEIFKFISTTNGLVIQDSGSGYPTRQDVIGDFYEESVFLIVFKHVERIGHISHKDTFIDAFDLGDASLEVSVFGFFEEFLFTDFVETHQGPQTDENKVAEGMEGHR